MVSVLVSLVLSLPLVGAYAIFAIGIVLIYRASRMLNLAHGAMAMIPAYLLYEMVNRGLPTVVAFPLAIVAGVAGCGRGSGSDASQTRTEEIPVKLTIKLRGDREATVENHTTKSQFVVIRSEDPRLQQQQVLGVEPIEPIRTKNVALRAGVAINPYRGDGTYTIGVGSAADAAKEEEEAKRTGKPRSKSSIMVEWWPDGNLEGENTEQFLRREKECKVKVEDDGTKGRVTCPSVTGVGVRFSLEMTWDVV